MNTTRMRATKSRLALWYDRDRWAYAKDREAIDKLADWVRQVDWKLFCTFTFGRRHIDEIADHTFKQFMNRLERHLKSDVGYVRGDEKRVSGCGKPACGRHYHALLTSAAPLQPAFVEWLWNDVAGNRGDDSGAKAEPYDATRNGAGYVLKLINQPEGDWTFGRLELFHPEARGLQTPRKRLRRHLQRHKARHQKFAAAKLIQTEMKIASGCTPS